MPNIILPALQLFDCWDYFQALILITGSAISYLYVTKFNNTKILKEKWF